MGTPHRQSIVRGRRGGAIEEDLSTELGGVCYARGMKRIWLLCFVCLVACTGFGVLPQEAVYERVRGRIVEDLAHGGVWDVAPPDQGTPLEQVLAAVPKYLETLRSDGRWPDVDLANRHRTRWAPKEHLERLRTLAIAYGAPRSPRFRDPLLRAALLRGLQAWLDAYPQCDNWWYNQIFAPQRLGEVLLCFQQGGGNPPDALLVPLVKRWQAEGGDPSRKSATTTGSNLMNIAAHWCYRGILMRDAETLRAGVEGLFRPLCITTGEGLQPDFSYHQHGPQLYLGNYGYDWLFLQASWLHRFRGTPYAPPAEQADLAVRYALEAFYPATRGTWSLFNAVGRQQASSPGRSSARKNRTILRWLATLAPAHQATFSALDARLRGEQGAPPPEAMAKVFWRSDYALAVRPTFTFDVRAVSQRTQRSERTNNENLLGYYLVEGATGFYRTGEEYADIAPLWNWFRVPGTTTLQGATDRAIPRRNGRGESTFVGGVSDGMDFAFAYHRQKPSPSTQHAWFVLDDVAVCLGAGITASESEPVVTTVNQCRAQGPVSPHEAVEEGRLRTPATLTHAGVRYTFPTSGEVRVAREMRKQNWKRVSSAFNVPTSGEVLTLWFDHGVAPSDASYAYLLSPIEAPEPTVNILSNTPALQAVSDAHGRLAAVFGRPGACQDITVSAPCILLQTPRGLWVADPTQRLRSITITLRGVAHEVPLSQGFSGLLQMDD